ncbi:hypothetical protein [Streptococcus infantis]|uniref:hypothetical protein n=1 Tax=Streptococcus infantis TaxID=68892 RepID=UPI001BD91964|nr:hypothetical protein [Streptococcus infantis]MBT0951471.1 hypothetical protein [Streptococcus infantis]
MSEFLDKLIESKRHSIELIEQQIEEYSQPCDRSMAQSRTAHREYLKKNLKRMKEELETLLSKQSGT